MAERDRIEVLAFVRATGVQLSEEVVVWEGG
jgi:hypothetical protein